MTTNRLTLPVRLPHAGEIRTGEQVPTRNGRTRPARLDTFRLTGPEMTVRAAADIYGGDPRPWEDAPTPNQWEVVTNTDTLHCGVILNDPDALDSGHWELWTGGGRIRRCDGQTCEHTEVRGTGDKQEAVTTTRPCLCDPESPECKPTTRLRVILPLIPGVGVWRLVTHSVYAAMEIPGVIGFLQLNQAQSPCPAYLRIQQREVKRPGEPTKKFPVVTLDPQVQVSALLAPGAFHDDAWAEHRPQLQAGREEEVRAIAAASEAAPDDEQARKRLVAQRWQDVLVAAGGDEDLAKAACRDAGLTSSGGLADDDLYTAAIAAASAAAIAAAAAVGEES